MFAKFEDIRNLKFLKEKLLLTKFYAIRKYY